MFKLNKFLISFLIAVEENHFLAGPYVYQSNHIALDHSAKNADGNQFS